MLGANTVAADLIAELCQTDIFESGHISDNVLQIEDIREVLFELSVKLVNIGGKLSISD